MLPAAEQREGEPPPGRQGPPRALGDSPCPQLQPRGAAVPRGGAGRAPGAPGEAGPWVLSHLCHRSRGLRGVGAAVTLGGEIGASQWSPPQELTLTAVERRHRKPVVSFDTFSVTFCGSFPGLRQAWKCRRLLPACIDNTILFIYSIINRCHLENRPITEH